MKISKTNCTVMGAILLILSGFSVQVQAQVEVNIGISVPLPPPLVIPAPPAVVLIPRTRVYLAPDIEADLLFYRGWWYRPHGGHWFRSRYYQGPWVFLHPTKLPRPLLSLPSDYRRIPPGQQKIPYGQLKKKWTKENVKAKKEKKWKEKGEGPAKIKKNKGSNCRKD